MEQFRRILEFLLNPHIHVVEQKGLFPQLEANQGLVTTIALFAALGTALIAYIRSLWSLHSERRANVATLKAALLRQHESLLSIALPENRRIRLDWALDHYERSRGRMVRVLRAAAQSHSNTAKMIMDIEDAASVLDEMRFDCSSEYTEELSRHEFIGRLMGAVNCVAPKHRWGDADIVGPFFAWLRRKHASKKHEADSTEADHSGADEASEAPAHREAPAGSQPAQASPEKPAGVG